MHHPHPLPLLPLLLPLLILPTTSLPYPLRSSTPTHRSYTITLPRFCRTAHCTRLSLTLLHTHCRTIRHTTHTLHADCPPTAIPSLLSTRRFAAITPTPTLRLLHGTFRNLTRRLPPPPPTRACSNSRGERVTVYVIDTGCRSTHEQLSGRVFTQPARGSGYRNGEDDHGHGTHVAATIAGRSIGLAPRATLVCIKALSDRNEGSGRDVMSGIEQVLRMHRPGERGVISISLGVRARASYTAIDRAVGRAAKVGLVTVVAAGNSGRDACEFTPARAGGAVTVAAVGGDGMLAPFSNFGRCVDVAAPGVRVWSAVARGDDWYGVSSGTSMAAPFVSGLVALWLGDGGVADVEVVRKWLKEIAEESYGQSVVSAKRFCRWRKR